MINIEDFYTRSWKIDKKIIQKHWHLLHWIHHNKKIDDYENIFSVILLYLIISRVDRFIEEKNESKYLAFDSADKNKEVLTKYTKLWDGIKNEIETMNGGKKG